MFQEMLIFMMAVIKLVCFGVLVRLLSRPRGYNYSLPPGLRVHHFLVTFPVLVCANWFHSVPNMNQTNSLHLCSGDSRAHSVVSVSTQYDVGSTR